MFGRNAFLLAPDGEWEEVAESDERAGLALQLLLQTIALPAQNVAHLMLGFEIADGLKGGLFALDQVGHCGNTFGQTVLHHAGVMMVPPETQRTLNGYSVLLRAMQSSVLPTARPLLFEGVLEVLYNLAATPETGAATLHLLRQAQVLELQLRELAGTPLRPQVLIALQCGISLY